MQDSSVVFSTCLWHQDYEDVVRQVPGIPLLTELVDKNGRILVQDKLLSELADAFEELVIQLRPIMQKADAVEDPMRVHLAQDRFVLALKQAIEVSERWLPSLLVLYLLRDFYGQNSHEDWKVLRKVWWAVRLRVHTAYESFELSTTEQQLVQHLMDNPLLFGLRHFSLNDSLRTVCTLLELPLRAEHLVGIEDGIQLIDKRLRGKKKPNPYMIELLALLASQDIERSLQMNGQRILSLIPFVVDRALRKQLPPLLLQVPAVQALASCWGDMWEKLRNWDVLSVLVNSIQVVSTWGYGAPIDGAVVAIWRAPLQKVDLQKMLIGQSFQHFFSSEHFHFLLWNSEQKALDGAWDLWRKIQSQLTEEQRSQCAIGIGYGRFSFGDSLSAAIQQTARLCLQPGVWVDTTIRGKLFRQVAHFAGILQRHDHCFYLQNQTGFYRLERVTPAEMANMLRPQEKRDIEESHATEAMSLGATDTSTDFGIDLDDDDPVIL